MEPENNPTPQQIETLRNLHSPMNKGPHWDTCYLCGEKWPCATRNKLEKEHGQRTNK